MLRAESYSDTWLTPAWIIDALGGADSFDLDPCASPNMPLRTARRAYTEIMDGLWLPWDGRVWLNPPYSLPGQRDFMERMGIHNKGTALVFAKPETSVWADCVWPRAAALLFIRGRVYFHHADGRMAGNSGGSGSVLVAYGQDDADVLSALPIEGAFVPLLIPRLWAFARAVGTWAEELQRFFDQRDGPVTLRELYAFFASHPKAESNPNYEAKVRQMLQKGRYVRVGSGTWQRRPV